MNNAKMQEKHKKRSSTLLKLETPSMSGSLQKKWTHFVRKAQYPSVI